jgi:hypothetical protein
LRPILEIAIHQSPPGFAHALTVHCRQARPPPNAVAGLPSLVRGPPAAPSPYLRIIDRRVFLMTRLQSELSFSPTALARLCQPEVPDERTVDSTWALLRKFPVIAGGKRK